MHYVAVAIRFGKKNKSLIYNTMPYGIFLQSELTDMATAIKTSEVGPIYLYKDSNGAISSSVSEHPFTSSFGYPFQFINGDVIMTALTTVSDSFVK